MPLLKRNTVLVTSKELVKENLIVQKKNNNNKAIGRLKRIAEERLPFIRFKS